MYFSDAGGNSSDLCTESNGCLVYVYRATDGKDSSDRESVYSVQVLHHLSFHFFRQLSSNKL